MAKKKSEDIYASNKEASKKSLKASDEMAEYLKKNKLDPKKDWSKDPVHGKKISNWIKIIRIGQEKAEEVPNKPHKLKKPNTLKKVKTVKNANVYNYPDIDGKPMPIDMKKKFRQKMRSLLKSNMDKNKAEKQSLNFVLDFFSNKDKVKSEPKAKKAESKKSEEKSVEKKKIKKVKKTSKED